MNEVLRLVRVQLIDVLVQATEVEHDHQERVQGSDRMIWLPLFDIAQIRIDQEESLGEFNVVHTANQVVLA